MRGNLILAVLVVVLALVGASDANATLTPAQSDFAFEGHVTATDDNWTLIETFSTDVGDAVVSESSNGNIYTLAVNGFHATTRFVDIGKEFMPAGSEHQTFTVDASVSFPMPDGGPGLKADFLEIWEKITGLTTRRTTLRYLGTDVGNGENFRVYSQGDAGFTDSFSIPGFDPAEQKVWRAVALGGPDLSTNEMKIYFDNQIVPVWQRTIMGDFNDGRSGTIHSAFELTGNHLHDFSVAYDFIRVDFDTILDGPPVPEPASASLLAMALVALALVGRRRQLCQ